MPDESVPQPEVDAAAATEVSAPPSVGGVFRQSLVYGLAGLLVAYDRSSAAARTVAQGVRKGVTTARAADADDDVSE